jgi:glucokinase
MLARSGKTWLSGDDVVTGSGVALLHEALTGEAVSPAEALVRKSRESATCSYFARFYARACRNYCLAMYPVEALIISGGIAAKNPHVIESPSFTAEFNDGRAYRHLLEAAPPSTPGWSWPVETARGLHPLTATTGHRTAVLPGGRRAGCCQ